VHSNILCDDSASSLHYGILMTSICKKDYLILIIDCKKNS
jgi:hypothetical protein